MLRTADGMPVNAQTVKLTHHDAANKNYFTTSQGMFYNSYGKVIVALQLNVWSGNNGY